MFRTLSLAAATLVWSLSAAMLLAQANPLEIIPDNSLGFVVIKDLSDTNERLAKLTQKMQLPVPDLLDMAKGFLGVDKGLDEKGGIALALVSGPQGSEWPDSALFAVVPVTDYKEFIAAFQPEDAEARITGVTVWGMKMLAANKGNFAILAFEGRNEALEKFLASTTNVTAAVEPLASWMADKQLALVVTPAGRKLLFQTIIAALPDSEQLKKTAGIEAGNEQASAFQNVGELFGMLKELLSAADKQLTHLAIGIRIEDNSALRVAARVLFVSGGDLAAWSKEVKAPEQSLLMGLPPGKFAIAYGGVSAHFSPEMWALFSRFGEIGMRTIGLDEENQKKSMEIAQQLQKGKLSSGGVMGMMRPGDSLFSTAVSVEHVKDAGEQIKISRQMFELMKAVNPQNGQPLYELNDVKVGELDVIEMVTSLGAFTGLGGAKGNNAGPAEAQVQGLLGKMFGADGKIRMYVAKADAHTVVTAYGKEQLVHAVEHIRSGAKGLEDDADIAKTAALLPAGAQWVAYVSPQGLVQWASVFVEALLGGEVKLPPFPATEPIGLAAKVSETGLDGELVLPDNVVAGIGQYIGLLTQMFQDGGVPLP